MGRTRNRLTAKQVENAKDGWYNDGGNLHLRVQRRPEQEMGAALCARRQGDRDRARRRRRVPLKLARELRDQHLAAWPRASTRERRSASRRRRGGRKTFAEAAGELIEARRKKWRINANNGRTSSLDDWTKHLTVDCKRIASRAVEEIGVDDIKPIVKPVWDSGHDQHGAPPAQAHRIDARLRQGAWLAEGRQPGGVGHVPAHPSGAGAKRTQNPSPGAQVAGDARLHGAASRR